MSCCISGDSYDSSSCHFSTIRKGVIAIALIVTVALAIIVGLSHDGIIPLTSTLQIGLTVGAFVSLLISIACCIQRKVHKAYKNYKKAKATLEQSVAENRAQLEADEARIGSHSQKLQMLETTAATKRRMIGERKQEKYRAYNKILDIISTVYKLKIKVASKAITDKDVLNIEIEQIRKEVTEFQQTISGLKIWKVNTSEIETNLNAFLSAFLLIPEDQSFDDSFRTSMRDTHCANFLENVALLIKTGARNSIS